VNPVRALLVGLATLLLTGCVIPTPGLRDGGHRSNTAPVKEFSIEIGVTTREDVLLALGEPDWNTPYGGCILYISGYVHVLVAIGGYGSAVIIPVGHHRFILVQFSEDGRVKRVEKDWAVGPMSTVGW
jgi:hypothetical protein